MTQQPAREIEQEMHFSLDLFRLAAAVNQPGTIGQEQADCLSALVRETVPAKKPQPFTGESF